VVVELLEIKLNVLAVAVNKNYNSYAENDVAVLLLDQPVQFDNYARAIQLPKLNSWPKYPDWCMITGFGRISGEYVC